MIRRRGTSNVESCADSCIINVGTISKNAAHAKGLLMIDTNVQSLSHQRITGLNLAIQESDVSERPSLRIPIEGSRSIREISTLQSRDERLARSSLCRACI